jgi:hypothetical protein
MNTCTAYAQRELKNRGKPKTVFGQMSKLMQISFSFELERIRHVSSRRQMVAVVVVVIMVAGGDGGGWRR